MPVKWIHKAGFVKGEQRYKCKKCGCQFVPTRQKGRSEEEKLKAVWLYAHGLSFRAIAKFLSVSACSVFMWVKKFAENNYTKPIPRGDSVIIELDEIWHFIYSKKTSMDMESLLHNNKTTYRLSMRKSRFWNICKNV